MEKETNNPKPDHSDLTTNQIQIRHSVGLFYDLQKLRIQSGNRTSAGVDTIELDEKAKLFVGDISLELKGVEKRALSEINRLLKREPIWNTWLKDQKGVGPTMGGVLIAYINVKRAPTASSLWKWCGLSVNNGVADRRVKGQKCDYSPFLKGKMVKVLAESFIKANSPWRKLYDDRKHRRQHQLIDVCMGCGGTGKYSKPKEVKGGRPASKVTQKDGSACTNCEGTGGPAPWGKSAAHRHNDAKRIMVKQFLAQFWEEWRKLEGLEVRVPYAEEYLGRTHHKHWSDSGSKAEAAE